MVHFTVEGDVIGRQGSATHSAEPHGHPECGSHPGARWYCAQTVPGREAEVGVRLEAQGFGAFLPMVVVERAGKVAMVPAFPSYLFTRFDVAVDRWRCIHSTRGVRRLFGSTPERPTPVPDRAIAVLLAEGWAKPVMVDLPALLPGQAVRVCDGPFLGQHGECLWSEADRVALMLTMFGRPTPVLLERRQVEAPPTPLGPSQPGGNAACKGARLR